MPKSPPKQRASAEEKALAEISAKKHQRGEVFRGLENDAIGELESVDADARSGFLAGRSNADLEAEVAGARGQGLRADMVSGTFGSGATAERGNRHAAAAGAGKNALRVSSDQQARDSIDQDTMNVIKTGQGVARGAQSGLTEAARQANSKAASKLNAEALRDAARANAIMEVASAGAIKGYDVHQRALGTHSSGAETGGFRTPNSRLSPFELKVRDKFGSETASKHV